MEQAHLFDHLLEHSTTEVELPLAKLQAMVGRFQQIEAELVRLELETKVTKERFNQISQVDIPNLLMQYGLSEIKLASGEKLRVTQELSASIKDMDSFSEFVTERGDDDILKSMISLGKIPAEVAEKIQRVLLEQFDLMADISRTVHPATLKKYIKETCGIGMEDAEDRLGERYVPLQELPSSIGVFTYFKTTIKKK